MTYQEVNTMLKTVGIPVTYYEWPVGQAPVPPYICFYFPGSDDFIADDQNYVKIRDLTVELYTDAKDFDLEDKVEEILAGMAYEKDETYIDSERMFEVAYTTEVIING